MLNKKCRIILRPQKKRKHNIPQGSFFVCLFGFFFGSYVYQLYKNFLVCQAHLYLNSYTHIRLRLHLAKEQKEMFKKTSTFKKVITLKNYFYENLMANFPFFFLLAEGNVRIKFNVFVGCLCVCLNFFLLTSGVTQKMFFCDPVNLIVAHHHHPPKK